MKSTKFAALCLVLGSGIVGAGTTSPALAADPAPTACADLEIIAHRGLTGPGVDENTVAAFDAAHERGYSIEIDVWVDREDVLWVFHDRGTQNLTGTPGWIDEKTTAEVEQLRYRKDGSPLSTLDEAMSAFDNYPDTRVYIEPKAGYLAADIANLVVDHDRAATTWITDFGDRAREAQPTVQMLEKISGPLPTRPRSFVRDGVEIVAAPAGRLVPATVARYQSRGIEVQGRNANSTEAWRQAIRAGADAQLTDRPIGLSRFCPVALQGPRIAARESGRTGPRAMAVRGRFFHDVSNLRIAGREVDYQVVSARRIDAPIKGIRARQVSVFVRTPNGTVERTVQIGRSD